MFIETIEITIAIPRFTVARPAPPVVLADGSLLCPRHPQSQATHQCTHCHEVLCDACVHHLRRHGGEVLKLCPLCSHPVLALTPEKKRKKGLFALLQRTVRLRWSPRSKARRR